MIAVPFHSFFTVVLLAAVILLILLAVISFGDIAAGIRLARLFSLYKCSPTRKIGSLWIDEKHRKWSFISADRLYDFSEIESYDIQLDGVSLKMKSEYLRAGCDAAELTADGNRTFERIFVIVLVKDKKRPYVNIPVGGAVQIGSKQYEKCIRLAELICSQLEIMKNSN